ncbi:MAG: TerB family tellurite resistance protein [Thermodesulfobacteriota bacterium]|nr:TerB family tellurite resistance protein [Thermodesulfobacteriota bacterium]
MGWLGKIVGGTIGFALGGPLGAIAGAAFGHTFDRKNEGLYIGEQTRLSTGEEAQFTFFIAAFSMLAKLAKADGHVSEEEVDTVNKFMLYDLNLDPESRMAAMNIFNAAIESSESFDDFAAQFYSQFSVQPQMLELMIDILLRVSIADGTMSESEERQIRSAARIFHFSDERYNKLKSKYVQEFEKYYAVLGCGENDTDERIKSRYRKLVMEYHPDKIVSKGLPEEFTKFAEDKFREIQDAYDRIRKERGIK